MTKKRSRGLRKCAYYRSRKCPHTVPAETGKFKCDLCAEKDQGMADEINSLSGEAVESADKR